MRNAARRLIDRFHAWRGDQLAGRLIILVMSFGLIALSLTADVSDSVTFIVFGAFASAAILIWAVGALALRSPLTEEPRPENGFEAWSKPSASALAEVPSGLVRTVGILGRRLGPQDGYLSLTLGPMAFLLMLLLVYLGDDRWRTVLPALADPQLRRIIIFGLMAFVILLQIRVWARHTRKQLAQDIP